MLSGARHDDKAPIQAAIDYAVAHDLAGVYCPAGNYRTFNTIYSGSARKHAAV